MSAALPGPVQHRSLSLFFPFHSKVEPCTAAHSFDMLTLNVSPLVFPQWASGEILKTPQVCALWPRTNISGLIQTAQRFGLGRSAFVYLDSSLQVHGFWQLVAGMSLNLWTFIYLF